MLSAPDCGWTDFELEGTSCYGLSYLTDIPTDWMTRAIRGLMIMEPFTVEGYLEPGILRCTVYADKTCLRLEDGTEEVSPIGMLRFCEMLRDDVERDLPQWAAFRPCDDPVSREAELRKLLQKLDHFICANRG